MPNVQSLLAGSRAFAENFVPFLLTAACVLAGLYIIFTGVQAIYRKAHERMLDAGRDVQWSGIAVRLLVGGLMLRLGSTVNDVAYLLTGTGIQDSSGVLAYMPLPQNNNFWTGVFEVCLLWVVMLGWAGAFRGLLLWNKAADGGNSGGGGDYFWQGFWHLVGGAAAVNLSGMIKAFLAG